MGTQNSQKATWKKLFLKTNNLQKGFLASICTEKVYPVKTSDTVDKPTMYKYHNTMIGDFTCLHRKQWASWKSLLGGRRQLPCGDNSEHCLLLMFCLLFPRGETLSLFSFLLLLFFLLFVVCCFLLLVVDISSILSFFLVFYLLLSEVILFVNILLYHLTMWINCADVHVCHCHQLLFYVVVFVVCCCCCHCHCCC